MSQQFIPIKKLHFIQYICKKIIRKIKQFLKPYHNILKTKLFTYIKENEKNIHYIAHIFNSWNNYLNIDLFFLIIVIFINVSYTSYTIVNLFFRKILVINSELFHSSLFLNLITQVITMLLTEVHRELKEVINLT